MSAPFRIETPYFADFAFAARTFAQRALAASAIRFLPAALNVRFTTFVRTTSLTTIGSDFTGAPEAVFGGLPRRLTAP